MFEHSSRVSEDRTDVSQVDRAWYAVRVRARSEQLVASMLVNKQMECFSPFWYERKAYSDRLKRVPVAVFPGYIFCRAGQPELSRVCTTSGVQYLVGTGRIPEAIEEHVVAGLQKAFCDPDRVSRVPYLRTGDLVQVAEGPLAGMVGTLLRVKGHLRLVLSVDVLERSLAIEVDAVSVVPLSQSGIKSSPLRASSPMN